MSLFVTVGSTKFDKLIEAICQDEFVNAALQHGYTKWWIQFGQSSTEHLDSLKDHQDLDLYCFDYTQEIEHYVLHANLIISHAGSGSILDALRGPLFTQHQSTPKCTLAIVPNESLLHNHQLELVQRLHEDKACITLSTEMLSSVFKLSTISSDNGGDDGGLMPPRLNVIDKILCQ